MENKENKEIKQKKDVRHLTLEPKVEIPKENEIKNENKSKKNEEVENKIHKPLPRIKELEQYPSLPGIREQFPVAFNRNSNMNYYNMQIPYNHHYQGMNMRPPQRQLVTPFYDPYSQTSYPHMNRLYNPPITKPTRKKQLRKKYKKRSDVKVRKLKEKKKVKKKAVPVSSSQSDESSENDENQRKCAVIGCNNDCCNRHYKSLKTKHNIKFGYEQKNWIKICDSCYYKDRYKYQKITRNYDLNSYSDEEGK